MLKLDGLKLDLQISVRRDKKIISLFFDNSYKSDLEKMARPPWCECPAMSLAFLF